jgi:hypothetical protein
MAAPRPLPRPPKKQDVAVGVRNLEAAQAIVSIFERRAEGCPPVGEIGGEPIRVRCIDEGIQPQVAMTLGVRQWRDIFLGLMAKKGFRSGC